MKYIIGGVITVLVLIGGVFLYFDKLNTNQEVKQFSLDGKCTKENLVDDAVFTCVLNNGTSVSASSGVGYWSHDYFKVTHFDASGNVLNLFSKNGDGDGGGEIDVSDITNGIFHVYNRVRDPCYDATYTFTFNLKTGQYSEKFEGGHDAACQEE